MAKEFTSSEWDKIMETFNNDPKKYGFPERRYGSIIIGSFNIRSLGTVTNRSARTWEFLAMICKQYDLLAIQEVQDNLEGLQKLMGKLGSEFGLTVSDKTGAFPGKGSTGERLAFIFRWSVVQRGEVVSDIS